MNTVRQTDDEQEKLWNGTAGDAWVEEQKMLDQMFKPFEALLVAAVLAERAQSVLDIGCGTGSTTLAVASRLGATGRCVGVDISEPMLAAARVHAERQGSPATFVRADAQTYAFEPATFDAIISRFGVMFFADPVRAFANLHRASRGGGKLHGIAWRGAEDNPFMTTAERAAAPLLQNLPPRHPDAPGQFAFADEQRVQRILQDSGWTKIDIQPIDVACTFPENELVRYLTRFGPLGRVLGDHDDETRANVIGTVRAAFEQYVYGVEVRFNAACWVMSARA